MKNNITELVFILDRSGSMSGFEADTIGGFNATIEKQKAQEARKTSRFGGFRVKDDGRKDAEAEAPAEENTTEENSDSDENGEN